MSSENRLEQHEQAKLSNSLNSFSDMRVGVTQKDIARASALQDLRSRQQHDYDTKLKEIQKRKIMVNRIMDLKKQLTIAENELQNYLKKQEQKPKSKQGTQDHYSLEVRNGKLVSTYLNST